jgi:2-polyprenyl-3-methyl-5-hydroxy-6-metoxy-1,4-benzoquinol methylase
MPPRDAWTIGTERVNLLRTVFTGAIFGPECFVENSVDTPEQLVARLLEPDPRNERPRMPSVTGHENRQRQDLIAMHPDAMMPHGLALLAYFTGETDTRLTIRRDDGFEDPVPVSHFFRPPTEFSPLEVAALERCQGHVLDIGAGSGLHALVMQSQGLHVTAIDISPQAVDIMAERGVQDVQRADVFQFDGGPFDTLLMLGHGIGMVQGLSGLDRFLGHAHQLTSTEGQVLIHSVDVRQTDDPIHLAYHETNRQQGRYVGMIRIQFEFQGQTGPYCDWLHVDPQTLRQHAVSMGWTCEVLSEQHGEYVARLSQIEDA